MKKTNLKDLGEVGLIERIARGVRVDSSVIKGIGDDAAVIKWRPKHFGLFASDMLVEGVHFDAKKASFFEIGRKALGVNLSDIAAMGGLPRYAVVSLGLPGTLSVKVVDGIYAGIRSLAREYNVNIIGGDTNSSKKIIIDIAIIGEVKKDELVLRSGARIGDAIVVTGSLGGSIKGRHLTFTPRIKESQFLVRNFKIHSMIDISDGLSSDLVRICRSSRVGAKVYESLMPLAKGINLIKDALKDGEDFELLFTVSRRDSNVLIRKFKKKFKMPISVIGEITKKSAGIKIVDRYGRASDLKERGFGHF